MTLPHPSKLQIQPRACVGHWTGGTHTANHIDKSSYHFLGQYKDGKVIPLAAIPVERNMRNLSGITTYAKDPVRGYAAHAGGLNTGTIGISMCGMARSTDLRHKPNGAVDPGPWPIQIVQLRWMLGMWASISLMYNLPVTERTFLLHNEVRRVYGVGVAKWDVTWAPGFDLKADEYGPFMREQLQRWLKGELIDDTLYAPPVGEDQLDQLNGDDIL